MSVVQQRVGVLDHIAWAAPDVVAATADLEQRLGAAPFLLDVEPGQYYRSGGIHLGGEQLLEVIGPNPTGGHGHPLRELLASLPEPRLLFWYIAVDDFDEFAARAEACGRPLMMVEHVGTGDNDESRSEYRRGVIGPDFSPSMPNVIQWIRRRDGFDRGTDTGVTIEQFRVIDPDPAALQQVFDDLAIDQPVESGAEPGLRLSLATPSGIVLLEGSGNPMAPA